MVLFRGDIKCKSLQRRTSLSVILPADNIHYLQGTEEIAEKPYKTLYLLHGLFGSDDIFLANTTIQKFAEDHNIAVVLPSGENSFYVDQKESHKYYGEFIGRELVEMTRNIFPLSHKKEDTYLAGFSMGGYGAIRNGLKYHDTFGYIGAISAALLTDDLHNWGEGDDLLSSKSFAQSCFGDLNKVIGSDMDPKFLIDDLIDNDIVETKETIANQSPERAENFKRTVMLTGVNDSSKENKFVSGAYKLIEGEHLEENDKSKILIHKDLAEKNNLKIGDKIKIKSNLFDADNEKGANETLEVEIKGIFDGHNKSSVTSAQELYENTLITDLDTAAKVYGNTEDTAVYQDATFFVKGDKNLDQVIKNIKKLDINWKQYNLIKSSTNYPALQQSISGIYSIANKLFAASLIFAGITVSLLLLLWMNARKKEIAIFLSLGISKLKIFGQFVVELVFISIPAYIGSYFLALYTGNMIGNNILNKVTGNITKQIAKQSASSGLGGGAEVDGFNKTLTSLDINILPKSIIYVILFMSLVLIISLVLSSISSLKKNPKELLIDTK